MTLTRPARHRPLPAVALPAAAGVLGAALWLLAAAPGPLWAHPGDLDEYGGHFDERTSGYHYHRPKAEMARRKSEALTWIEPGRRGELRGRVVGVDGPDALWIALSYRPAYQELVPLVAPSSRDDQHMRVRVFLRYVAPAASVDRGAEYDKWFAEKVAYELKRKLGGKPVTVQFRVLRAARRLTGLVHLGEENVNLWMVLNGWSYYVLTDGDNPNEQLFIEAEDLARKNAAGLWSQ